MKTFTNESTKEVSRPALDRRSELDDAAHPLVHPGGRSILRAAILGSMHTTPPGRLVGARQSQRPLLRLQRTYGNRFVQRILAVKRKTKSEPDIVPEIEQTIERKRGGGQTLDANVRPQMEAAIGGDFNGVRVHTDSESDSVNQALNARAFTTGKDIFFRRGEYQPGNTSGRELLAHELTHVVQQNPHRIQDKSHDGNSPSRLLSGAAKLNRLIQSKLTVGSLDDVYEQEADRMAQVWTSWEQKGPDVSDTTNTLRRQPEEEEPAQALTSAGGEASKLPQQNEAEEEAAEGGPSAAQGPPEVIPEGGGSSEGSAGLTGGSQIPSAVPVNEATDEERETASAVVEAEAQASNAQQEAGPGPDPGRDDNPIPVEDKEVMGGLEIKQHTKQEEEKVNLWSDASGHIDLWPTNLYVAMNAPPNLIKSSYNQGYQPRVIFNHEFSMDTHSGPSGHYKINGTVHDNWDNEDEWTSLTAIPTSSLSWPAPDSYDSARNTVEATFITRPDFHVSNRTVRAASYIGTFATALTGAPTENITGYEYNQNAAVYRGLGVGGGETSGGGAINVTVSQAVSRQTGSIATGSFGSTTSFGSETSAGVSGKIQEKDKWELGAELSGKWTEGEERSASRTLSESVSIMTQNTTSVSTSYNVPQGIPCAIMLVPVERHITNNFSVRDSDGNGQITDATTSGRTINRTSEIAAPGGWTAVYGYDEQYATALRIHYNEVRALRQQCTGLRGRRLEAKKREIRQKITIFRSSNQPSEVRAQANARSKLASLTASPGRLIVNTPSVSPDNVKAWQVAIDGFWSYADSPT